MTENLGNEKIAYIKIDENEISAKIPSQKNIIDQIGFDIKDISKLSTQEVDKKPLQVAVENKWLDRR